MNHKKSKSEILAIILFIIYLIALFEIILFKLQNPFHNYITSYRVINLIPFHESRMINGKLDFKEMYFNIIIFIPLGIYLYMIFKKWSVIRKIGIIFGISLLCETLQYIMEIGASDITDLINNTLGGLIGLLFMAVLSRLCKKKDKLFFVITILSAIGTFSMLLLIALVTIANL